MAYKTNNSNQRVIAICDPTGADITTSNRFPVDSVSSTSNEDRGSGSVPGVDMRYEKQGNVDLPPVTGSHITVYEITEESIFHKIVFQLDSDNIYIQVEIDGQDIFPAGNGILFEDLESLCLGGSGGGYGGNYGAGGRGDAFGLYQYDSNKWIWEPPQPLYIAGSMKIKMKASTSSTSTDYLKGIAIRRSLV